MTMKQNCLRKFKNLFYKIICGCQPKRDSNVFTTNFYYVFNWDLSRAYIGYNTRVCEGSTFGFPELTQDTQVGDL